MEERRGVFRVLVGQLEGKSHWRDLGIDGRKIIRWIFKKQDECMDWIDLAQVRDRWHAVVNAVLLPVGSKYLRNVLTVSRPVSFC
jgi:hypothetical protein